ncbi:UNVERIFIED_CONTAM: manganese/zinc/iron transport system permease protein [Acetivibrio alkalicellulosi]
MIDNITYLFKDYTLKTVILGCVILGITSGILGTFAVLRKQSLLGDAISHSALPGIVIAFLLTGSRSPVILLTGALFAGWFSSLCMMLIVRYTKIKYDGALAIILSVFFGFGMVMLSIVQKLPNSRQAGLNKFLFGQAATLLREDIFTMGILAAVSLLITFALWKEFKLLSFNSEFGNIVGFPMKKLDLLLTCLIVISIVVGLQTVGVVLMSAMLIAPAAASRQWTDRLEIMAVLGGLFGALSGITGAIISSSTSKMPTGPLIVLVSFIIFLFSLLFAPKRGILKKLYYTYNNNLKIKQDIILTNLYHSETKNIDSIIQNELWVFDKKLIKIIKKMEQANLLKRHDQSLELTLTGLKRVKHILLVGDSYE